MSLNLAVKAKTSVQSAKPLALLGIGVGGIAICAAQAAPHTHCEGKLQILQAPPIERAP